MILHTVWLKSMKLHSVICVLIIVYKGMGYVVAGTIPLQSLSTTTESSNKITSDLRLLVGRKYFHGQAYLIPRPIDEVKAALLNNEHSTQGLSLSKTTAYTLGDMEQDWVKVYYHFHPQFFAQEKIERLNVLKLARLAGNVAPQEEQRWKDIIHNLSPNQAERGDKLLNNSPITRYTFTRDHLGNNHTIEEHLVLIDVSMLVGPSPLTLLWYAGEKTTWHREKFKFFTCMSGVTCIPNPHWEKKEATEDFVNVVRTANLEKIARSFSAYSSNHVRELIQVMDNKASLHSATASVQPPHRLADGSVVTAEEYVLPGIGRTFRKGPIRSLSGGHFYFPIGTKNDAGSILLLKDGEIDVQPVRESRDIGESKVDAFGRLWRMQNETPDWSNQILHSCPRLVHNSGKVQDTRVCMQSTLTPRWLLRTDGRSYLYAESHMATHNQFPKQIMDMHSGETMGMQLFWKNRSEIIKSIFQERFSMGTREGPDLGDGLFWFIDYGLVGISPETGKAEKGYGLNVKAPIFGSSAGDWVLAKAVRSDNYKYAYRVQRLSSGEPIFELIWDFEASAYARTAHGKLLAMSEDKVQLSNHVLVWDMHSGKNIARVLVAQGMQIRSIAFNREGTELWMQVWQNDSENSEVLIWRVPASLRDAADNNSTPYEFMLKN